jgi:hypothetical protein
MTRELKENLKIDLILEEGGHEFDILLGIFPFGRFHFPLYSLDLFTTKGIEHYTKTINVA